MDKPIVSVLVNGRNYEAYVKETIDSIYAQTYPHWEIIFIDNCSVDSTANIVKKYDKRLTYIKTSFSMTLGQAKNVGLSHCKSDYIAFLDSDDRWLPDKLEIQIKKMIETKKKISYTGGYYIDQSGKKTGSFIPKYQGSNIFAKNLKQYKVNQQSLIIATETIEKAINKVTNEDLEHAIDFDIFIRCSWGREVLILQDKLVEYRIHPAQQSHHNKAVWHKDSEKIIADLIRMHPDIPTKFPLEFRYHKAKAAYLKARYFKEINEHIHAFKTLFPYLLLDFRYFILGILAILPGIFWTTVHRLKRI